MAKFKVGDRVKIVNKSKYNYTGGGLHLGLSHTNPGTFIGQIGFVIKVGAGTLPYRIDSELDKTGTYLGLYSESDLELITPQYTPITPKVGDRYRVVKKYSGSSSMKEGMSITYMGYERSNGQKFHDWKDSQDGAELNCTMDMFLTTEYLEPVEDKQSSVTLYQNLIGSISPGDIIEMDGAANPMYQTELITKTNTITKMTNFIKKLTQSADDKVLEKARFMDSCGELTSTGSKALESLVFADYKEKLVALAKEVVAEEKE